MSLQLALSKKQLKHAL